MQKVEGSNPFIRSMILPSEATWPSGLGTGLQNPLHRFNSGRRLLRFPLQTTRFPATLGGRHLGFGVYLASTFPNALR
jgi:hypothetical protein